MKHRLKLIIDLMKVFDVNKEEGERNVDFEERIFKNAMGVLGENE